MSESPIAWMMEQRTNTATAAPTHFMPMVRRS